MTHEMSTLESSEMKREEFHVSSLVVLAQPAQRHQLAERIATLEGAEIHAVSEEGKLVVTLETESQMGTGGASGHVKAKFKYERWLDDNSKEHYRKVYTDVFLKAVQ